MSRKITSLHYTMTFINSNLWRSMRAGRARIEVEVGGGRGQGAGGKGKRARGKNKGQGAGHEKWRAEIKRGAKDDTRIESVSQQSNSRKTNDIKHDSYAITDRGTPTCHLIYFYIIIIRPTRLISLHEERKDGSDI